jgi:biotin transport system substrate-specific component
MQSMTYVDRIRPSFIVNMTLYNTVLVIAASLLITASAYFIVPLPFTPIPVTAQTFAVLLLAALLGRKRAVYAVLLYLMEGIAGLPVFAGGNAGFIYLMGMTGGYLLGFVPAAYFCGFLAEKKWDRKYITAALLFGIGITVIYLFGVLWLAGYTSFEFAIRAGLYPFIAADVFKIFVAIVSLPSGWKLIDRLKP